MLRRAALIVIVGTLALALPATALARKKPVQPTDPSANSPAGAIYAIPLDSARQDASPHSNPAHQSGASSGGAGGGTGGSASSGSSASSSLSAGGSAGSASAGSGHSAAAGTHARANPGTGGSKATSGGRTEPTLVPGGQPGSLIHSSNGYGSSSLIPGVDVAPSPGLGSVDGNGDAAPVTAFILVAAALLVGGFVGLRASR